MYIKKFCSTCGRILPRTNDNFVYKNKELDIFYSRCKVCRHKEIISDLAAKNPNEKTENSEHIEKIDERMTEF